MKLAKEKKKRSRNPEPEIVEVESPEDFDLEQRLSDIQRMLAEAELRIQNINSEIEERVNSKVNEMMGNLGAYMSRVEMSAVSRLIEFFNHSPLWEVTKVTKSTVGASEFYSPFAHFKRLMAQGWKFVGTFYDEKSKERYEMFVRQKDLPRYKDDLIKLYQSFLDQKEEKTSAKAKSDTPTKLKLKIKTKQK